MEQNTIDFEAAAERRRAGMQSSVEHADSDAPGWSDHALALMRQYACQQAQAWTVEQFRGWAYERGLQKPDEERAFGAVTQKALRAHVIERVGYAPTSSSNGSPKPLYAKPAEALAA